MLYWVKIPSGCNLLLIILLSTFLEHKLRYFCDKRLIEIINKLLKRHFPKLVSFKSVQYGHQHLCYGHLHIVAFTECNKVFQQEPWVSLDHNFTFDHLDSRLDRSSFFIQLSMHLLIVIFFQLFDFHQLDQIVIKILDIDKRLGTFKIFNNFLQRWG